MKNNNLDNIINVRIDKKLYDDLQDISNQSDIKISKIIRTVLIHYIETYYKNNDDINLKTDE